MNIGFIYGSFDPFTNGHFNLVSEAAKRFDKVIVTIRDIRNSKIKIICI